MLIDNKEDRYPEDGLGIKTVWDFINKYSGRQSGKTGKLDIVTGYFTLKALSQLYREIPEEDDFRIVSSEMVREEQQLNDIKDLINGDFTVTSTLQLEQYAKEAKAFLERHSVQIRAIANAFCHAKVYTFKNAIPLDFSYYLTGSSNLTDAGLGLKHTSNVEMTIGEIVNRTDSQFKEVCRWFEDIWQKAEEKIQDPERQEKIMISVKDYFIRMIEEYFRKYTPEEIYYKILYELFNADIDIDSSIEHEKEMARLQTSVIWKTLFNYQQKGVISLIKMLRHYNGAILADAVGLGKTFSALAVIKYFQTQGFQTLILCPKKLKENWEQYLRRRGSRFEKDEFDYLVRFHTDLQNDRLQKYDDVKLDYLQRAKNLLIVIDESHNLRNEDSGRYKELMETLIKDQPHVTGRDVKVLMLSATPINTGLNDVKGQFNLIGHDDDTAFNRPEFGVESLKNLFADSQRKFTRWCADPNRTIGTFIPMLQPKFFNLTDKLIVARTRKLIERVLDENLGFPNKLPPINIYKGVDHFGQFNSAQEIHNALIQLSLTAYQPSLYMTARKGEARQDASQDWESNVNRERFLVGMMVMLFMKRLESSWYACMQTVKKVLDAHEHALKLVKDYQQKKADGTLPPANTDEDEDEIMEEFTLRKGEIRLSDMKNLKGFEAGLVKDVEELNAIYTALLDFQQKYHSKEEKDEKLERLIEIISEKQSKNNKKVVIFTAFSDTARFLFEELSKRGFKKMAAVSGSMVLTTGRQQNSKFTEILQSFAPYSKLYKELDWRNLYEDAHLDYGKYYNQEKDRWEVPYEEWQQLVRKYRPEVATKLDDEIDILIATDCLSEGQNLQDADMQINYDIHWNPVRLIQRFGRIDRLGSPNKAVQCVNFWPVSKFEDYLKLEKRVMDRMMLMNLTGAETQELNEKYKQMLEDNPLIDKHADSLLAQLQNNSISDIETPQTLTLKDFSFEIYRQDLIEYFEQHKEVFRKMPNGIFTGFRVKDDELGNISESLVAVVGYPRREQGENKPYQELYLICQPVDKSIPATYEELNRAEVLEFLRKNKRQDRYIPAWIEKPDNDRLKKLQEIVQAWMKMKAPQQSITNLKNRFHSKGTEDKKTAQDESLDKHFQLKNFDLIVWEFISK